MDYQQSSLSQIRRFLDKIPYFYHSSWMFNGVQWEVEFSVCGLHVASYQESGAYTIAHKSWHWNWKLVVFAMIFESWQLIISWARFVLSVYQQQGIEALHCLHALAMSGVEATQTRVHNHCGMCVVMLSHERMDGWTERAWIGTYFYNWFIAIHC